jgi:hypothetical protein
MKRTNDDKPEGMKTEKMNERNRRTKGNNVNNALNHMTAK